MKRIITLPENSKQRAFIKNAVSSLSDEERLQVSKWASEILQIQKSEISRKLKAQQALKVTRDAEIGKATLKILFETAKRSGSASKTFWANRSKPAKIGIGTAAATLAIFGTQGAGIAAFGTAIGLPLWMVTSAGAMFAATLAEEARKPENNDDVVYFVPSKEEK